MTDIYAMKALKKEFNELDMDNAAHRKVMAMLMFNAIKKLLDDDEPFEGLFMDYFGVRRVD